MSERAGKKTQEETIKKESEKERVSLWIKVETALKTQAQGMAGRSILPLPTYLHSEAESSGKSLLILSGPSGASSNVTTQTTGITYTSSYGCSCKMQ